ncbi:MAG: leucine-rich repeat domain-containing protein [Proteobacteria bacterium]|nr:leucine-rich repeat domain-containing protein [Pseudomonadota bacterium]
MKRKHQDAFLNIITNFTNTVIGVYNWFYPTPQKAEVENPTTAIVLAQQPLDALINQTNNSTTPAPAPAPVQEVSTSLTHHGFFSKLPSELISYIFEFVKNPHLQSVSKPFFAGWENLARKKFFSITSAIQPLEIDATFETLNAKQQEEINFLTKNQQDILENNKIKVSRLEMTCAKGVDPLEAVFEKIAMLKNSKTVKAYHVKEAALNLINETIIRKEIKNSMDRLYLNKCYLTRFPDSVLNDNRLNDFWKSLRYLDLSGNQLTCLSESIGKLSALQWLSIAHNNLSSLPESIGQLSVLEGLHIQSNNFSSLPEAIGQLSMLKQLCIQCNRLSSLPNFIGRLSALQELHIQHNCLSFLPESIGQLNELQLLHVNNNQIKVFPETLAKCEALWDFRSSPQNENSNQDDIDEPVAKRQRLK